jgi:hypothetical protein
MYSHVRVCFSFHSLASTSKRYMLLALADLILVSFAHFRFAYDCKEGIRLNVTYDNLCCFLICICVEDILI